MCRCLSLWRVIVGLIISCSASDAFAQIVELPAAVPQKRGDFAFRYTGALNDEEMEWLRRFEIVVPGNFLPPEQVTQLHASGTRLVHYVWLPAFGLHGDTEDQMRLLLKEHPDWVLNAGQPLFGHAGPADSPSYYFDYAVPEMRQWLARDIARRTREHDYDGVFFDTTTINSVHPDARKIYEVRHPETEYDACVSKMLSLLKAEAPEILLFTNQGYRAHEYYLPHVDLDLTESYMTTSAGAAEATVRLLGQGERKIQETHIQRWHVPGKWGESISAYCRSLLTEPIAQHGYDIRVMHLNYGYPRYVPAKQDPAAFEPQLDREAVHYGLACALLLGHTSYYEVESRFGVPADEVYFVDLGQPVDEDYHSLPEEGLVFRRYENGFVVVNDALRDTRLTFPEEKSHQRRPVYDVFQRRVLEDFAATRTVNLPANRYPATRRITPSGRIFVYQ